MIFLIVMKRIVIIEINPFKNLYDVVEEFKIIFFLVRPFVVNLIMAYA